MNLFSGVSSFVQVVDSGGFRAASAKLGVSPAAVSKAVAKLEAELGAALLERSSRHVRLTPAGSAFLDRCREAIAQLRAGRDQVAREQRAPQGTLRVSLPPALGSSLLPLLSKLLGRYPRLALRLVVTNRVVKVLDEEIDVALRMGPLADSALMRRRLRTPRWLTVASPVYLQEKGMPSSPAELMGHTCMKFALDGKVVEWRFRSERGEVEVATPSRVVFDESTLLVEAAVQGMGVAQVFDFMVARQLETGSLVQVLSSLASDGPLLHALLPARRAGIPRVRVFLNALEELLGVGPGTGARRAAIG